MYRRAFSGERAEPRCGANFKLARGAKCVFAHLTTSRTSEYVELCLLALEAGLARGHASLEPLLLQRVHAGLGRHVADVAQLLQAQVHTAGRRRPRTV